MLLRTLWLENAKFDTDALTIGVSAAYFTIENLALPTSAVLGSDWRVKLVQVPPVPAAARRVPEGACVAAARTSPVGSTRV